MKNALLVSFALASLAETGAGVASAAGGITRRIGFHDLRHTCASWQAQQGKSSRELREMGGWTSQEMVRRYAHLDAHAANFEAQLRHSASDSAPAEAAPATLTR